MTNEPPKVTETGLYSVKEAAKLLGVSCSKLYDAIKRGARCVELMAECDAITDAYSLRAKKFSAIGEDNV